MSRPAATAAPAYLVRLEAVGYVRPYLVAHEQRLEALRLVRRRTLRIAPYGMAGLLSQGRR